MPKENTPADDAMHQFVTQFGRHTFGKSPQDSKHRCPTCDRLFIAWAELVDRY